MQSDDIILDFDGTLVLNNSARKFESITFKYNKSMKRHIIYLIFFSDISKIFNKIFAFISILLLKGKDFRLYLYVLMSQNTIIDNFDKITNIVASDLALNTKLYDECRDKKITVLSKGFVVIIEKFLKANNIKCDRIVGSNIGINGDKIYFSLLSFENKMNYLEELYNFIYYTDSISEIRYINNRLKNKNIFIIRR